VRLTGPVTMQNAASLLVEVEAALARGECAFEFDALDGSDSAAVALLLAVQRAALARGGAPVRLAGIPDSLRSFAQLYGVADLLPALAEGAGLPAAAPADGAAATTATGATIAPH